MTDSVDQLTRLIALVPFLLDHPGVGVGETADHFGISEEQLVDDLNLLFVSGRPGHMPDDLIDVYWEGGNIYLTNAPDLAVPMRLSADEAATLVVALASLLQSPVPVDEELARSVREKLVTAARGDVGSTAGVAIELPHADPALSAAINAAIAREESITMDYYVASRDETTTRTIDPEAIRAVRGVWYVEAYCHLAVGMRRFRLDNILRYELTPRPGGAGKRPRRTDGTRPLANQDALPGRKRSTPRVTVVLEPDAAWLADDLPTDSSTTNADGSVAVSLAITENAWLTRLLLHHGDKIRDVEPASAVETALALAREATGGYENDLAPQGE